MEPSTQHGGPPAEQRCKYIFRFYSFTDLNKFSQLFDTNSTNLNNSLMNYKQFR